MSEEQNMQKSDTEEEQQKALEGSREEVPFSENYKKTVWGDFSHKGRTCRHDFWLFHIIFFSVSGAFWGLSYVSAFYTGGFLTFILITVFLQIFLFVRRLHDIGGSGYWSFLFLLVPLTPLIVFCGLFTTIDFTPIIILAGVAHIACFLILGCIGSQGGTNQYGDNPNGEGEEKRNLIQKINTFSLHTRCIIYSGCTLLFFLPSVVLLFLWGVARSTPEYQYAFGVYVSAKSGMAAGHEWFQNAAEQEHTEAQYMLGLCYKKDKKEAVRWFSKAGKKGHTDAQYMLGLCYFYGEGVKKDKEEAVRWLLKAEKQGHAGAQRRLGVHYYEEMQDSYYPKHTIGEVAELFKKAAEQGDVAAQYNLYKLFGNDDWKLKAEKAQRENMMQYIENRKSTLLSLFFWGKIY